MTVDELGRAFRKAMLQTDPEGSEDNRAGAALLAVLDALEIVYDGEFCVTRQEVLHPHTRLEWKK